MLIEEITINKHLFKRWIAALNNCYITSPELKDVSSQMMYELRKNELENKNEENKTKKM